jgi:hypothetical protein
MSGMRQAVLEALVSADAFSPHIGAVARHLWGDPNAGLSSKTELRWGNHGSRSVDLDKGVWFDNEAGEGGGVIDLVTREAGVKGAEAVSYLRESVGIPIEDDRQASFTAPQKRIVATYDYRDETGDLLFQVCRFEPKDFRQRRPDPSAKDGWNWSVKGVRQVPYRLPEVLEVLSQGGSVFIVEGEKDADALWKRNIPATCNAGGAGKWPEGLADLFVQADVVILPDNDDAGRNHAAVVGASMRGVASSVRVLDLPGLPQKGDVSDWLKDAANDVTALWGLVESRAKPWTPAPPASRFGAVMWSSMDAVKARHDWLIEDMMFCGDFGLSYGASQSGKSFLTLDASLAIARGIPFLGRQTMQGAVIYQAGEGGLGLLSRMKAYRTHHEMGRADVPFILLPSRVDLYGRDGDADAFIQEVLAWQAALSDPLRLVVIDTFATASPGANENASEDVSRVLHNAQRLQEAAKCAVLLVHHKNAAGEKPRGHTSLYANADAALEVIRDETNPKERTLRIAKVKDGEDGAKIGFRLQPVTIGSYDSGKPITSCVVVPAEEDDSRAGSGNDKRPRVSPANKFFINALRAVLLEKGGISPGDVPTPSAYTRVVEWPDFTRRYRQLSNPDENDAAVRQRIKRSHDDLLNWRFIGRHEGWIWLTEKGERT